MAGRKLYNLQTELRVIRTLTLDPDSRAAQELLSKVDDSFFATETCRAAYKTCLKKLRKSSELPDWEELVSDPNIDESIRDELETCELPVLDTKKRTLKVIERLNDYRRLRLFSRIGKQAERIISSTEEINIDDEFAELTNTLSKNNTNKNFSVLRIGKNSNSAKYVDKLLKGEAITYIPTGFKGFDSINRGLPAGSFMLLASPTGRGKSTLISQLGENMAMSGAKIGTAPLEMSNLENLQRNVSRVTQTDMTKLLDPQERLNKREIEDIKERFAKHDRKIERNGGQLEFYEFDEDIAIEGLTATVKPFGLDVLIIDYLGLLDGTSGDDQWRALGNAARYCHVWGKANNCSVIAAAQLSEEGMLRYSRQLAEHAKYFWYWAPDENARSTGIYEIVQRKARNASDHSFYLQFDLGRMTVTDAEQDAVDEQKKQNKDSKSGRNGDKVSKKWEKESSVGWGDDDDDSMDNIPQPKPGRRAHSDVKRGGKRSPPKREIEL